MKYIKYIINGIKPKNFYYIFAISLRDSFKKCYPSYPHEAHMKAAMEWLSHAQKQNGDGGVSALYSLFEGWAPSYVETTGYIIPTFFNYADILKEHPYKEKAIQMADFELRNQLPSSAFPGYGKKNVPIVFNTGQVIFGLCRTYEETKEDKYKKAAEKAAQWLISVMDDDGCWRKNEYLNCIHIYNTQTA